MIAGKKRLNPANIGVFSLPSLEYLIMAALS